jgi:hypothetical protein
MKKLLALLAIVASNVFAVDPTIGDNALINGALNGNATGWTRSGMAGGVDGAGGEGYTFSFQTGTIAQTYAINQALQGSGIQIYGFNYGLEYRFNCGQQIGSGCTSNSKQDTLNATITITNSSGGTIYSQYYGLGAKNAADGNSAYNPTWQNLATEQRFNTPRDLVNMGNFTMSITGMDAGFWGGNYGPNIRNAYSKPVYGMDNCAADPLSSTTCSGYAAAYLTQQCAINALYDSSCPGYAQAVFTQQCNVDQLSNPACPGYAAAYLNYQCSLNSLYSTTCPGYSAAYAKKNILNIGSTTSTNTNSSTIVLAQSSDPVAQAAPVVSDPVVNSIVTTKSTAATAETNPAAAVKLTAPAATTTTTAAAQDAAKDNKKTDSATTTATTKDGIRPDRPVTTREAVAEQRREAARREAVQKGKDLANEMGRAADMQAQMEVQNVVIQAMGYSPGFDNYGRFILPDGNGYKPFTIYNNQRTVDTPAGRGLFGGSDSVHQRMVDSQYNLGK